MLITFSMEPDQIDKLVSDSLHESIKNLCSMHGYQDYPDDVKQDLAALSRVYQYYTGKAVENWEFISDKNGSNIHE
jgi:hypothetical protein